jgi:hypothetical protein
MSALGDSPQLECQEAVPTADLEQCEAVKVEVFAVADYDDDIDWERSAREAHADFEAGALNFISTHAEPMKARAALRKYLDGILEEVLNGIAASPGTDAACR